ncbi:hypothetical protein [Streptomyces sp. NPDC056069]|uniref:hypothetical protein n=1 Tax=Streptomyces sp. NPDC056069 TaxID=3345702 RepID=UPI0035DA15DF
MPPVPSAARPAPIGIHAPNERTAALPTAAPRVLLGADAKTAALEGVASAPCPCGHTIVLAADEAALLLPLAHGMTTAAIARQLGLKEQQVTTGIKALRTVFGVERIPHLVDSAIRWGLIDPGSVAPIRPGRLSRDLKATERGALANAAAGSSAEASAKNLGISTGRVHKVLAAVRDVLLARDTTHAVTLGHRLRLLPDTHPHFAAHEADPTAEAGAA